ncbi:hypothetical protein [Ekhidna sp.]|uniref:hypothetical protein n=1 Tax=Ekhidna sp. TaxID=2608089 RepID=UPI0032EB8057
MDKKQYIAQLKKRSLSAKLQAYIGLMLIVSISFYLIMNIGQLDFRNQENIDNSDLIMTLYSISDQYEKSNIMDWEYHWYFQENNSPLGYDSIPMLHIGSWVVEPERIKGKGPDSIYVKLVSSRIYVDDITYFNLLKNYGGFVAEYQNLVKNELTPLFNDYIKEVESASAKTFSTLEGISRLVIRVGTVIIAFYLIQILLMFTRYQFRYSDFLSGLAFSLEYSNDSKIDFETLATKMDSSRIILGKSPKTGTQEIIEMINSLKGLKDK